MFASERTRHPSDWVDPTKEALTMNSPRWLLLLCCSMACACTAGSGGSSTASNSTCDVTCQDQIIGYALDETLWLLWNENFAGQPSGNQSRTVNCPLGGTAQVSGTTGVATNGINTIHLTLNLQSCENSNTTYSLAFTGSLTWDGSFSNSSANAVTLKSSSLDVQGTVKRYDMPDVSQTCAVSLTDVYNKQSSTTAVWLNGEICGREVSE
jgi:hypothetical protein